MSVSALIDSSVWSRWSSSAALPALPGAARPSPWLIRASVAASEFRDATLSRVVVSRSAETRSSEAPVSLNADATPPAASSIADRAALEVGSPASVVAEVKKLDSRVPSTLPSSEVSMRSSHVTLVAVLPRSDPEFSTSACLNMSPARLTPMTAAPSPLPIDWALMPPIEATSLMLVVRRV